MGLYDRYVLPYLIEVGCGVEALAPMRRETARELQGAVLEIGFGSGMNLPFLPSAVTHLLAVDPSSRGRELARKRLAQAPCPVEFVGLDAQSIALPDASADTALCTFTLCTIPEPLTALREVRRILKPGGTLHLLEHGRAPDPGVQRWQDRLNGVQQTLFGGCNLNRDIAGLVRAAGFRFEPHEAGYMSGTPRTHGYVTRALAS
ncbi:MAG TPA: class I SAM-dependent methyltransferase [Polyangiales bacterium]